MAALPGSSPFGWPSWRGNPDEPPQTEPGSTDTSTQSDTVPPEYTGAYWRWLQLHPEESPSSNSDKQDSVLQAGDPVDSMVSDLDPKLEDPFNTDLPRENDWSFIYNKMVEFFNAQANFNQHSADKEMEYNAEQAKINRDWQEYMQNTYYERMVEGMKRAGLNPQLLALGTLQGASSPSGSMASGASSSVSNYANSLGSFLDYFIDTGSLQIKGIESWIKLLGVVVSGLKGLKGLED